MVTQTRYAKALREHTTAAAALVEARQWFRSYTTSVYLEGAYDPDLIAPRIAQAQAEFDAAVARYEAAADELMVARMVPVGPLTESKRGWTEDDIEAHEMAGEEASADHV